MTAYLASQEQRPRGRWLVDKYPCIGCAKPVWVRTLSDVEHARCLRCSERKRLERCAVWAMDRASHTIKEHNRKHDEWLPLARWVMEAASHATNGASLLLQAAMVNDNEIERGRWIGIASNWSQWASELIERLREPLDSLAVKAIHILPPPDAHAEVSEPRTGHLRIVTKGDTA